MENLPFWFRWVLVVIAPPLAFMAANIAVHLYGLAFGGVGEPPPRFIYYVVQPGVAGWAAVYACGYIAPRKKMFAGIYGLVLVVVFTTFAALGILATGNYWMFIPTIASLVGGIIGISTIDDEYDNS